ncbi:SurA N-terminal domain-containing protein [Tindallia californiensis]|uniref:peptidylprolyl isomerase n=1 Tax=Tindallia californiensis TaxID=159292 RepID=A0A1H3ING4_9FIRM|nr:SurA N-terminal domain-containing protein [Tindallia californiensis]SDY28905.1 SurA N-terminal domain-containing protein [Tindallia californiensis]
MVPKKRSILLVTLLLTMFMVACGGAGEDLENDEALENGEQAEAVQETGEPVAMVNGEAIDSGLFQRQLERSIAVNEQQGMVMEGEDGDAMKEQLKEQLIEQLVQQEVIFQEATAQGVEVTEDDIKAELDMVKEQFETEEQFLDALEVNQFTEDEFKEMLTVELTVDTFLDQNSTEVSVEESELREYYDLHEQQYQAQMEAMEAEGQELSEEEMAMMELPPYEEMKEQLREQLIMEKQQEEQMALINDLMEESEIEIML